MMHNVISSSPDVPTLGYLAAGSREIGCFGAMPVCHGARGLAGQYKFGARNGLSVAILRTPKMVGTNGAH